MERYFELTAAVRAALVAGGEAEAADELLGAERSASTSGELISNVAVVLSRLGSSGILSRAGADRQARELEELGWRAWNASNNADTSG